MIELVVWACLAVSHDQCRYERIGYRPGTTQQVMTGCQAASQMEAARWAGEHPKHVILRIECRRAMEEA